MDIAGTTFDCLAQHQIYKPELIEKALDYLAFYLVILHKLSIFDFLLLDTSYSLLEMDF